jgi:hypothetical protein
VPITPVVLTVVATLLAGLSSSEMTYSQYYRSLASQYQSKVADQWAFFQAKRSRSANIEMTVEVLLATADADRVDPDAIRQDARDLAAALARGRQEADALLAAIAAAGADLGPAREPLRSAAERLQQVTARPAAEGLRNDIERKLADPTLQQAFVYLAAEETPRIAEGKIDDPVIQQAVAAVVARRPMQELERLSYPVDQTRLAEAIRQAEANAKAFDDVGEPTEQVFRELEQLINQQVAFGRSFHRAARDLQAVELPADNPALADVRAAVARLGRTDAVVHNATRDLNTDFKTARLGYTARRNRQEANYNLAIANLYEVQVHKSSAASERHRSRSMNFFLAMLGAQAGVAISSLALAAKRKSTFWTMAGVLGLAAMAFSAYVYLYM